MVNWAMLEVTMRGVERVTSSQTQRVPAPDMEHMSWEVMVREVRGMSQLTSSEVSMAE